MPELPEVETILNGIKPHIVGEKILQVDIHHPRLRWPIPGEIQSLLKDQTVSSLTRRGKYLLIHVPNGTLIIHLGMSGRLCVLENPPAAQKHDHVDIHFANNKCLRFTDPRRFGAFLWTSGNPYEHPLLAAIGPEPLSTEFNADYLWQLSRKKKAPVKSFIMNSRIVAGIGNIYATEALFQAKLHPRRQAGKLGRPQCEALTHAIKNVLKKAIKKGGTTLKDYLRSDGTPGYFRVELQAYGHDGEPCHHCHTILKSMRIAGRSTVYCPRCQHS